MAEDARAAPVPTPSERFFNYFQHEVTDLQTQMSALSSRGTSGGERADAVDHCLAGIARLSDEVHDASSYLPAYDQRTYAEAIRALSSKLQSVRAAFAPRPRFAFRGPQGLQFQARKNASAISLADADASPPEETPDDIPGDSFPHTPVEDDDNDNDNGEVALPDLDGIRSSRRPVSTLMPHVRQPSFSQTSSVQLSGHDGLHIILPPSAAPAAVNAGSLSLLTRCIVDLSTPSSSSSSSPSSFTATMASLTVKDTRETLLLCGRVGGAVHLTRLTRCVVVVEAGQFRMHESRDCDVYLRTTGGSHPVIEDCSGIRFAPLPEVYASPTAAAAAAAASSSFSNGGNIAGDDEGDEKGSWSQVEDFQWLRADAQSPNWRILSPDERLREEVWRDVVPGRPNLSTNDILRAVGLPP